MPDDAGDLTVSRAAADRVLHSDPHDFAGLYIRHRASFTLHARRYLRDARDADEVVQEAFLRLFLALPELETELQALAYCRRTITNLCIDRFRAQARRPRLVGLDSVPDNDLAQDDSTDPVIQAEDAALVRAALSMLSPLHRAALVKREIEEKPLPVIAEELEIPEESVKHVLFRARRALRKLLAGTSVAPGMGDISEVLVRAVRKGSSGLAGLAALLVLAGLSAGPDLHAVPVVGQDLPDLPSIVQIAGGVAAVAGDVGGAIVEVAGHVAGGIVEVAGDVAGGIVVAVTGSSSGGEGDGSSAGSGGGDTGPLLIAPSETPSPSADPGSATATVTLQPPLTPTVVVVSPIPVPSVTPSTLPTPTQAASSPTPQATAEASAKATAEATQESSPAADKPRRRPSSDPSSSASPSPSASASASASAEASSQPSGEPLAERYSGEPAPSPSATPHEKKPKGKADPSSYQTDGVAWVIDPETGDLVRVSLDEISPDGTYRPPG